MGYNRELAPLCFSTGGDCIHSSALMLLSSRDIQRGFATPRADFSPDRTPWIIKIFHNNQYGHPFCHNVPVNMFSPATVRAWHIREFAELRTPTMEPQFKRFHLPTFTDSLGEPSAHPVKALVNLDWYYL